MSGGRGITGWGDVLLAVGGGTVMAGIIIGVSMIFGVRYTVNSKVEAPVKAVELPKPQRIRIVEEHVENSYAIKVLEDTQTGVQYLSYDRGLVKLETPNGTK